MKSILVRLLHVLVLLVGIHTFNIPHGIPLKKQVFSMKQENIIHDVGRTALSSAIGLLFLNNVFNPPAFAADYAPPTVQQVPQTIRQAPKAVQVGTVQKWTYSTFLDHVEKNEVEKVTFSPDGKKAIGVDSDGDRFSVDIPNDPNLLSFLVQHKVDINVAPINSNTGIAGLGLSDNAVVVPESPFEKQLQTFILPGLLNLALFGIPAARLLFPSKDTLEKADQKMKENFKNTGEADGTSGIFGLLNRLGGPRGPNGMDPTGMSKSQAKIQVTPNTGKKFTDVAGCEGAKEALVEIVDFLKNPQDYTEMGAKIPRGVLLSGPPGTGKTLLAKAVAGEAGVPFITTSGAEFVQIFVGVGASRVRDMFQQARKYAPCIVFIDEIDAIGRERSSGGGNDEREQTLNQILVEMDGFAANNGIIVVAATNRPDVLDAALLRPGRFDRKVEVPLPDFKGRVEILKVHARDKVFAPDIDLEQIARRTPGLSGASLKAVLNEASLRASGLKKTQIDWEAIDWAIDRVTIGMENSNDENGVPDLELVAFHEAGHAVVGGLIPEFDTVTKISIVPRSNGAGGLTFFSPLEDRLDSLVSRHFLESQIAVAWGGRVAEEMMYGATKITGGAYGDLKQITRVARAMVYNLGMSRLPPISYDTDESFRDQFGYSWNISPALKQKLKSEILRIISNGYFLAKKIIAENEPVLYELARRLLQDEQVSQEEFHFLLYEFKAKTVPYGLYGDTKVDEMPYTVDIENAMEEAFNLLPRLSSLLPIESEVRDPEVINKLPQLRKELDEEQVNVFEGFPTDLVLDEDWGKSRKELIKEAKILKAAELRKQKLMQLLNEEERLKRTLPE
mmetsp:Transcript_13281/g.14382  ORF Transcript_13281/g.14382 Transcript_13281/m.14382 type:complete len:846 (+) Transcript_13281:132-2669(+)